MVAASDLRRWLAPEESGGLRTVSRLIISFAASKTCIPYLHIDESGCRSELCRFALGFSYTSDRCLDIGMGTFVGVVFDVSWLWLAVL